jgi:hypothetical protein
MDVYYLGSANYVQSEIPLEDFHPSTTKCFYPQNTTELEFRTYTYLAYCYDIMQ